MKELKYNNQLVKVNDGTTGFDLLKILNIEGRSNVLVYKLNGELFDLATPVEQDGEFSFVTKEDEEAFAILNHDAAHLMAQAILSIYPGAKFGIGPDISEGFYYDVDFSDVVINDGDLAVIEAKMMELSRADHRIERQVVSKEKALEIFAKNEYKVELINEIEERITIYSQGDFVDLCYGPHMPSTRYVQHFKLLSLAGAYWRGDASRKQLTRIYGVAFFSKDALDKHLYNLEEAKKRDHRKLGRELGLFMLSEYGPGFPFWLQKGMTLYHELEHWWIKKQREAGYEFEKTPQILSRELWEI